MPPARRVAVVLALLAVPWTVLAYDAGPTTLVFAWGLVNPAAPSVTTLAHFLGRYTTGLPSYILAWPLSVLCYVLALASAVVGAVADREDTRVTAGLLVCAGIAGLSVARGFALQPGRVAYPLGTAACWGVAWYVYARA
ncbi:TIGR04206 family protein [Haloplanus halobius]|uniref:TIGR04206 family protein n=1 Tax=Haloplanus halobius TaxID=2934938 RepID=UPI00200DD381